MKKIFYLGLILGFIVGIIVAISMDFLFSDALGGSWSDAVRHDLSLILQTEVSKDSLLVILGVIFVVSIVGVFGAIAGGIVAFFLSRFFQLLRK